MNTRTLPDPSAQAAVSALLSKSLQVSQPPAGLARRPWPQQPFCHPGPCRTSGIFLLILIVVFLIPIQSRSSPPTQEVAKVSSDGLLGSLHFRSSLLQPLKAFAH